MKSSERRWNGGKADWMDNEQILICAVRYCLGRHSYVVAECIHWVRQAWPTLSQGTRHTIRKDVETYVQREEDDADRAVWTGLLAFMGQPEAIQAMAAAVVKTCSECGRPT